MSAKKISILGCGWLGFALAKELLKHSYTVKGSTTTEAKLTEIAATGAAAFLVDFNREQPSFEPAFFDCDVLVISFPPRKHAQLIVAYPDQINNIVATAEQFGVKEVILISSTGVYEDGNFVVDESVFPNPTSDSGKNLLAAENALRNYNTLGTTIIRFAGLFGPERNLARHFSGRTEIPNGLAPVNLIHLSDCLGIIIAIIDKNAFGNLYHGVSPTHPIKLDFYTRACLESKLPIPDFKSELLKWKQIESVNVPDFLAYKFDVLI